jgi:hypothetical protein
MSASSTEPVAATGGPPSSPSRHLLTLIVDALAMPGPASVREDEAAYLALMSRRAGAVLTACRQALACPGDDGTLYAARDLFDAVSGMPAAGYRPGGRQSAGGDQ